MDKSLKKRIRRHVVGRSRKYFAAAPPGLEKTCFQEITALPVEIESAAIVPGGIEFNGRIDACYLANLHSRTANRILLRIGEFSAANFRRLEKQTNEIPWELYLQPDSLVEFHVQTVHSRLYHKEAVSSRIEKSIQNRLGTAGTPGVQPSGKTPQKLFVRVINDRFTVSIDSSGDLLYKRGVKTHGGKAPIRETLAAYALAVAGYDGTVPLLDPMCGSGTFSLEAAMIATKTPPGFFRKFAFMEWPSFLPDRWRYFHEEAKKYRTLKSKPSIFASDSDLKSCKALKHCVAQNSWASMIEINHLDFFNISPDTPDIEKGIVAINPPYGLRLGEKGMADSVFSDIIQHLTFHYKGWRAILIAPDKISSVSAPLASFRQSIVHGGKKRYLVIGQI